MILIAVLLCILSFYILIDKHLSVGNVLLKLSLAYFFCFSLLSLLYICILFLGINFIVFQIILIIIPIIFLLNQIRKKAFRKPRIPDLSGLSFPLLIIIFLCILIFTVIFFLSTKRWGAGDAWQIWTLHAKFLVYKVEFANLFGKDMIFSHADYPLMLPGFIAMVWRSLGTFSSAVPMMVAYINGALLILMLFASFYEKKFTMLSVIVMAILTCPPVLFPYLSSQYSDTLLAVFILVTFILMEHIPEKKQGLSLFMIGFFSASCGWIKNEGLAFFVIFTLFFIIKHFRNINKIKFYLAGIVFPLLVVVIFKIVYAPSNDLIAGQSGNYLAKLFDVSRYITIMKFLINVTVALHCQMMYILLASILIINYRYFYSFSFAVIFILLTVYFFVYVFTPLNLNYHLYSSYDRLLHHVFPALMYTVFLSAAEKFKKKNVLMTS